MSKSMSMKKIVRKLLWNIAATILLCAGVIGGACIMHLIVNYTPGWLVILVGLVEFVVIGSAICIEWENQRREKERRKRARIRRELNESIARRQTQEDKEYYRFCKECMQNRK